MSTPVVYFDTSGLPVTTSLTSGQTTITETATAASTTATVAVFATFLTTNPASQTVPIPTSTTQLSLILLPGASSSPTSSSNASTSSTLAGLLTGSSSPTSSATASRSSSSASTSPSPNSHSGASSASIVGAALGCLIGGALLAGFLVWFFMRSRHRKQRSRHDFSPREQITSNSGGEDRVYSATGANEKAATGWEQHLPQSESDATIRTSVKALFDQIELHVENFYRNAVVSISPGMQTELQQVDSRHLRDSVIEILPQTRSATTLIKHCLAQLIVSHITAESDVPTSFLPADLVALPRTIKNARANGDRPAFAQALSRWRVLSSYLRPQAKYDAAYLSARDANITATADNFCSAFTPWASNPNNRDVRFRNLVDIMKSAAETGIMIFSQPSTYEYCWTVPTDRERKNAMRMVVAPGFAKTSDEHAKRLPGRGQELLPPVVAPVVGT